MPRFTPFGPLEVYIREIILQLRIILGGLGGVVRYSGELHKGGHFVHLALPRLLLYKETTGQARPGACTYYTQLHCPL